MIRSLEQQFGQKHAAEIRKLADRARRLTVPQGSSRYFAVELAGCLEAGLLLAAGHVAASLLELAVRGIVLEHTSSALGRSNASGTGMEPLERRLEEMRNLGFAQLVDQLREAGLFNPDDAELAKLSYQEVRIPIFHGLVGRYIEIHNPGLAAITQFLRAGPATDMSAFEEVVEPQALEYVGLVIGILERNST